jgi:A/G-specific adenine glycosylase
MRRMAGALLDWYGLYRRDLPWRRNRDPYAIWVSEVMLQQTQAATVTGYYARWMQQFPSVQALAQADEQAVLRVWQGLGYYARARGLLRAARAIVRNHAGRIPESAEALRALPGIGPYAAGAIASIAYDQPEPIVDGNVTRVLCRLFELAGDPTRAPLKRELWQLARALLPEGRPGDFNQALMELGATLCTPRQPRCRVCPVRPWCAANLHANEHAFPHLSRRVAATSVHMAAALIHRGARALVVQLPEGATRWAGMWQFPNAELGPNESPEQAARRAVGQAVGLDAQVHDVLAVVRHSVTRYRIRLEAYQCTAAGTARPLGCSALKWLSSSELEQVPMPSAHRRLARHWSRRDA